MKKTLSIFLAIVSMSLFSANTDNHTVTVSVSAINELALSAATLLTLTINAATAGSEPTATTDTSRTVSWTTNEASKKITVASGAIFSNSTLKVLATSVSGGSAASQVTLSTTATDFVTGVGSNTGSATLSYEASATAAQGTTGDSTVTITYTLAASA